MDQHNKQHWQESGAEPDYRFSLANERTFLAWIRTALALLAGAILIHQFATHLQPQWMHWVLTVSLLVISAALSCTAFLRWKRNEIAMRHAQALPRSRLVPFMAGMMTAVALFVAIYLSLQ